MEKWDRGKGCGWDVIGKVIEDQCLSGECEGKDRGEMVEDGSEEDERGWRIEEEHFGMRGSTGRRKASRIGRFLV